MTYYEEMENMCHYPDTWDYYKIHRCQQVEDYFRYPYDFLQKTFTCAQKQVLAPTNTNLNQFRTLQARAAHSVSTLFLGTMMARNFCNGRFLNFRTNLHQHIEDGYSFPYICTLTALYHDCGYSLEKDEDLSHRFRYNGIEPSSTCSYNAQKQHQKNKVGHLLSNLSINKTPWRERDRNGTSRVERIRPTETNELQHNLFTQYNNRPKCVYAGDSNQPIAFPYRSEDEIIGYAAFRLTSSDRRSACVDHGIFGGYRFFDSMIKNYVDAYKRQKEICSQTNFQNFCYNGKRFCTDQISLFAYIADCIINHNIWRQEVNSRDGEICRTMGLYYVLGSNYEKIRLLKNPLLFILSFADSLEPYKLFCKNGIDSHSYNPVEVCEIFNKVELTFHENILIIKVPPEMNGKLRQSLKMMDEWLAIRYRIRNGAFYISPVME